MLGSDRRLRHNKDFIRVFKQGKRHSFSGVLLSYTKNDLSDFRIGFIISKKYSHLAVRRNKQRRVLQSAIKKLSPTIKPGFDIIISYTNPNTVLTYKESCVILTRLLKDTQLLSH